MFRLDVNLKKRAKTKLMVHELLFGEWFIYSGKAVESDF